MRTTVTVPGTLRDRFKEKIQNLSRPYLVPGMAGFSLIEIIIVVAVIAMISGVFMVRTAGINEQSKIDRANGDLRVIEKAIHTYYLNHGGYPSGGDWQTGDLWNENPRILPEILYDPFYMGNPSCRRRAQKQQYLYSPSPNGVYYVVRSVGSDGQIGISGISDNGQLQGAGGDDIFVTNGTGTFS